MDVGRVLKIVDRGVWVRQRLFATPRFKQCSKFLPDGEDPAVWLDVRRTQAVHAGRSKVANCVAIYWLAHSGVKSKAKGSVSQ